MRTWLILSCMLFSAASPAVPVWTWVDEHGLRHYSDRPVPGARLMELASAPVVSLPAPAAPGASEPAPNDADAALPAAPYTTFAIASPADGQTLWNIEGRLEVRLELAPALQPGHRLDVEFDGRRLELAATAPQFTVPEVYRGAHTLNAVIVDDRGVELLRSPGVTFVVQQTSILNPNNPQSPR